MDGEQGEAMVQAALASLSELGVAAPQRHLKGYYPELVGEI